jgi:hypothetical protein
MRAIQQQLPNPRHTEVLRIFVKAPPEVAWETARHFDMSTIPWVRLFFDIRLLPDRLRGLEPSGEDRRLGVDQVTDSGKGFMLVHETPGKEVVVASVGQFWHLHIPFAYIEPAAFKTFRTPGYGKLAWAIAVEPYLTGSTISLELRTTATDEDSWQKLNAYYHFIGIGSRLIREASMQHLVAVLGKLPLPDDDQRALPGDECLPQAQYALTHHVNIEAPPEMVWPYLMQLGCDRAGWYSIDWLDHGGVPSIDHLVPGWEKRSVGDKLAATPARDGFFEVLDLAEKKHLVLGAETQHLGGPYQVSWAFILEPLGDDATHLISRARMESAPKWAEWLIGNVIAPPVHGLMSGAQLKHLRSLAERDARQR